MTDIISDKKRIIVFWLTLIGLVFFSGSIYLLTTKNVTSIDISSIAFITPIGGMLLIIAWVILLFGVLANKRK